MSKPRGKRNRARAPKSGAAPGPGQKLPDRRVATRDGVRGIIRDLQRLMARLARMVQSDYPALLKKADVPVADVIEALDEFLDAWYWAEDRPDPMRALVRDIGAERRFDGVRAWPRLAFLRARCTPRQLAGYGAELEELGRRARAELADQQEGIPPELLRLLDVEPKETGTPGLWIRLLDCLHRDCVDGAIEMTRQLILGRVAGIGGGASRGGQTVG